MDTNQIKRLLTKYAEANSTLEEERMLQDYFSEEPEIDVDLQSWKHQFVILKAGRDLKFDISQLESRISDQIDESARIQPAFSRRLPFTRLLIAASVALIIGIGGAVFYKLQHHRVTDTFTDPQLAYIETQKALIYISQTMNKGIEPLSNISKINTGTDKLKTLGKMDQSLGMLNLVSFINKSSNLKK